MRENAFLTGARLPFRSASRLALMLPALLLLMTVIAPSSLMAQRNVSAEQTALGFAGKVNDDLWTVNFLRQNALFVNGRFVPPALVLEGFVTFQFTGTSNGRDQALVFAEFPLLQRDVERFKTALVRGGVDVAALHNHELFEVPRCLCTWRRSATHSQ